MSMCLLQISNRLIFDIKIHTYFLQENFVLKHCMLTYKFVDIIIEEYSTNICMCTILVKRRESKCILSLCVVMYWQIFESLVL